jgi:hypothetical protein
MDRLHRRCGGVKGPRAPRQVNAITLDRIAADPQMPQTE